MEIKLAYPALKKAATSRVIALPQLNRCQRRTNIYDHTVESQNKSMHAMLYLKKARIRMKIASKFCHGFLPLFRDPAEKAVPVLGYSDHS